MRDESEHEVDAEGAGDVLWRILYGAIATRAAGIVAGLGVLFAARERTESQWRQLIEGAGLQVDAIEDGLIQATCR